MNWMPLSIALSSLLAAMRGGQYGMELVWHRAHQGFEESHSRSAVRLVDELDKGRLAGTVYGDIQMQLALCGVNLGQINVEIAYWVALELLFGGFIAFDIRKSTPSRACKHALLGNGCRGAASIYAGRIGTNGGSSVAARKDNHPAAREYAAGRRQ